MTVIHAENDERSDGAYHQKQADHAHHEAEEPAEVILFRGLVENRLRTLYFLLSSS